MARGFFSRGFSGRRRQSDDARLPPGQYFEEGFPVLSAGPMPRTPFEEWDFSILGEIDEPKRWTWEEFRALPSEEITRDIHCVTKWSKLGTRWQGVSVDTLLEGVETAAEYVTAFSDGDYTTNLPLEDVTGGKAWVAYAYEGEPLEPEHGGPARLLVPHCTLEERQVGQGLQLTTYAPGFWSPWATTTTATRGANSVLGRLRRWLCSRAGFCGAGGGNRGAGRDPEDQEPRARGSPNGKVTRPASTST